VVLAPLLAQFAAQYPEIRPKISVDDALTDGRNWLHLHLYTHERDKEVDRLLGLGAKRYPWRSVSPVDFVVLEDPDGNLFCVVQKDAAPGHGRC
jgi:hypothetical protein